MAWVPEFGEDCLKYLLRYINKKMVLIPFDNYYYLHAVHYWIVLEHCNTLRQAAQEA